MMGHLLAGLKVLDLTHYIAGPYCTRLLAGLGAEVIKVERPRVGDPARHLPPFSQDRPGLERSGTFLWLNQGKKSVTLHLQSAPGVELMHRLVAWADVCVENFAPRVLPNLGLAYAQLAAINPRLVLTSISNFGQSGPYRDYRAQDLVLFGMGGSMASLTPPDDMPFALGGTPAQIMGGAAGFTATLGAVYGARMSGVGQHVDVSMFEAMASSQTQEFVAYAYRGTGGRPGYLGLIYPCQDGYVMLVDQQPHQWEKMTQLIGHPELVHDPRLHTVPERRAHRPLLDSYLGPWIRTRTKVEVYHAGQQAGIPCAFFATVQDVVDSPQMQARAFLTASEHPEVGTLQYPGVPFRLGDQAVTLSAAPLLGQHNAEVFGAWFGLTPARLERLRRDGVL
jgi:CoA:oxalate CoA-transferase